MNVGQLESFVDFAESQGLWVNLSLLPKADGKVPRWSFMATVKNDPGISLHHCATKAKEAIRGGLAELAKRDGVPLEPSWYWRTLEVCEEIEEAECSELYMNFSLAFQVVRLERLGFSALGAIVTKVLQDELTAEHFEHSKEDLDDVLRSTTLRDFINNLDGLLVWSREFDEVKAFGSAGDSLSHRLRDALQAQV